MPKMQNQSFVLRPRYRESFVASEGAKAAEECTEGNCSGAEDSIERWSVSGNSAKRLSGAGEKLRGAREELHGARELLRSAGEMLRSAGELLRGAREI